VHHAPAAGGRIGQGHEFGLQFVLLPDHGSLRPSIGFLNVSLGSAPPSGVPRSFSSTASRGSDDGATNDEQSGAAGAKVPLPKGIAGKPPFPRTTTKDSRSAAADTLRRFFNRR